MKSTVPLLIAALFLLAPPALAFNEKPPAEAGAQLCYGYAMVGFDSVINARLGVPAEYALGLALTIPTAASTEPRYSTQILNIALGAYLWQDNPHDYAVEVFYNCAKGQDRPFEITAGAAR